MTPQLNLVVVADVHYTGAAVHTCLVEGRQAALGLELVRRVVQEVARGAKADALVLMGDLVDNGSAQGADRDLAALKEALDRSGLPVLVVPGNHDGPAERLFDLFGDRPGVHCIKGHGLVTFADPYDAEDRAARSSEGLALVGQAAAEHPDAPLLVFQHNPVYPPIENDYPYNLTNSREVAADYARNRVRLSVSGHLHAGQPLCHSDGVGYVIAPALCEDPFAFLRVTVRDGRVDVMEVPLRLPDRPRLWDLHVHTQYAYCADDVEARAALERVRLFGPAGVGFAEHAPQLYVAGEDFWSARFLNEPSIMRGQREAGLDRMRAFRSEMEPLRGPLVKLGLEVECDCDGRLTLLEEDRDGLDYLIGAVHWLPESFRGRRSSDIQSGFMKVTELLLRGGVDILAHPFRFFRREEMAVPEELFRPMAQLLAEYGAAAEINFHTNVPNADFFRMCLEEGVRIALGSDSHALYEIGFLGANLELLRRSGGSLDDPDVLFVPHEGPSPAAKGAARRGSHPET